MVPLAYFIVGILEYNIVGILEYNIALLVKNVENTMSPLKCFKDHFVPLLQWLITVWCWS